MIERQNSTECRMAVVEEDYTDTTPFDRPVVSTGNVQHGILTATSSEFSSDERVVAATLAALEQHGSLTPLIKDELKAKIQTRRFKEGQDEIKVEFNKPKSKTMTKEEMNRALVRREQNRTAAQRFRMREKDTASRLLKKTQKLQSRNTMLRANLAHLRREKAELDSLLYNHILVCHNQSTGEG